MLALKTVPRDFFSSKVLQGFIQKIKFIFFFSSIPVLLYCTFMEKLENAMIICN